LCATPSHAAAIRGKFPVHLRSGGGGGGGVRRDGAIR
jgi:hypothetical protein